MTCLFMVCALKDFKVWRFHSHFEVAKGVYEASKWHSCAKKWFRSFEIPSEMKLWLQNWEFLRFVISQPFRSCEMRVTVLRNGTRVPKCVSQPRNTLQNGTFGAKSGIFTLWSFAAVSQLRNEGHCAAEWHSCAKSAFAAAKSSAEWDFWCEIRLYHFAMRLAAAKWMLLYCEVALVCQDWFRSCQIPCGMELSLRNGGFHALVVRSRFRSCEMGATVLRSGTRVPNLVSQLRNALAETSTVLRNGLATKCRFRRGCEISQTPVFPLFFLCFRSV